MSDSRQDRFEKEMKRAADLEEERLKKLKDYEDLLQKSLKRIDELLTLLKPYYRLEQEAFNENSLEYKTVDIKVENSSETKKVDLKKAKKELKDEYKKLKYTPSGIDLLKVEVSVGGGEKKSALTIMNQATSALAEMERLEERRERVLSEKGIIINSDNDKKKEEAKQQAIITEIMLDEVVSSLKELHSHLEKDPSKLSKADREIYIDPEKNVEGYSHFKQVYESLQRNPIESVLIKDEKGVEKNGIAIAKKATFALAYFDKLQASAEATLNQEQSDYKLAVELQVKEKTHNFDTKHMDSFAEKETIAKNMQEGELTSIRLQEIANMIVTSPQDFANYIFTNDSNKTFAQENWNAILKRANSGLSTDEYKQAQANIQHSKELLGVEESKPAINRRAGR